MNKQRPRRPGRGSLVYAPSSKGLIEVKVADKADLQLLSEYWTAVHAFFDFGEKGVREFDGESITAMDGTVIPLVTDLDELERLGYAGAFSFESMYAEGN